MNINFPRTRAQESRAAIERMYIMMRHLFNRGYYKPFGRSGSELMNALLTLRPEIYGSMDDSEKVELDGLVYVIDRLPKGIEECRLVKLTSEEGYDSSHFEVIVPAKRRRNCYRIGADQMFIEVTRGRSEIYDILTHLTFLFRESEKIRDHAFDEDGSPLYEWLKLEEIATGKWHLKEEDLELAFTHLSVLLGRTFEETKTAYERLEESSDKNSGLFNVIYHLGRVAMDENSKEQKREREISFTPTLRSRIGHHIHGEKWASDIKQFLAKKHLIHRPLHIISANLHSIMNCLYGHSVSGSSFKTLYDMAVHLSNSAQKHDQEQVRVFAEKHGMYQLDDQAGTNIHVQIFDTSKVPVKSLPAELGVNGTFKKDQEPVLVVMDYAFGEQAYETMDELLKPLDHKGEEVHINVESISIMGKAGVLYGGKGDLMIPNAHVFEGTADNYPFENDFAEEDFAEEGVEVYEGPMITVLGTSLQNRDVLQYFKDSSWKAIGLEMEGAHYQKAIQSASKIRKSINANVVLRYAYYASDNPLISGATLASGSLGLVGVKPTYLITLKILQKIFDVA